MDPNIMKFLEEDEDETMHSGADVEAFTAELNRDIEGNASTSQQPSDSDGAVLSQGSNQPPNPFFPQWQTSSHEEVVNFSSGQDVMATEEKDQHLSQLELQQRGSDSENRKEENDSSHQHNSVALPQQQNDQNTFPVSQSMDIQTPAEHTIHIQEPDQESNQERELQMQKLENMSNHQSLAMGSNSQQPVVMTLSDQQSLSAANQHATGMGMSSQQAVASGLSMQPPMTSNNQQPSTTVKLNKQVPFGMLLPIIQPQLDKDRAMQLNTLYIKLKKNEVSKEDFVRHMRSIVGDQMLKMAVYKLQNQASRTSQSAPNQFQSRPEASARQLQMPSTGQIPTDFSNPMTDSDLSKSREMENQADSQGFQVNHMSNTGSSAISQDRKHPAFPTQGLNKQQHMHFSQASFPTYGSSGSSYSPFSTTNVASSTSLRVPPPDSQMRQGPTHHNMSVNHLGPTTQTANMMNMSKFDRPHSFNDPKKLQAGNLSQLNNNAAQQNQAQWPSSTSNEQKSGSSSMNYVKQEPVDQSNEHHKAHLFSPQGLSSVASAPFKPGNAAPGNSKDESFEMQSSKTGFTPSTSLVRANSMFSSIPSPMETSMFVIFISFTVVFLLWSSCAWTAK